MFHEEIPVLVPGGSEWSRDSDLECEPAAYVEHPDGAFGWIQRRVFNKLRVGRDREAIPNGHPVESLYCILVAQAGPERVLVRFTPVKANT